MSIRSRSGNTFKNALEKFKFTQGKQRSWAIKSSKKSKTTKK
jgi:hypothetical protein